MMQNHLYHFCRYQQGLQRQLETLDQCMNVIAPAIDTDPEVFGDLFIRMNGIKVQLENELSVMHV